mmetsp:Transcript_30182/g.63124  ORF Transcript_30182/g.63124 Transcript_30182/m.63124 type:complete len:324 (-) Transcript_30182:54-1025(-)
MGRDGGPPGRIQSKKRPLPRSANPQGRRKEPRNLAVLPAPVEAGGDTGSGQGQAPGGGRRGLGHCHSQVGRDVCLARPVQGTRGRLHGSPEPQGGREEPRVLAGLPETVREEGKPEPVQGEPAERNRDGLGRPRLQTGRNDRPPPPVQGTGGRLPRSQAPQGGREGPRLVDDHPAPAQEIWKARSGRPETSRGRRCGVEHERAKVGKHVRPAGAIQQTRGPLPCPPGPQGGRGQQKTRKLVGQPAPKEEKREAREEPAGPFGKTWRPMEHLCQVQRRGRRGLGFQWDGSLVRRRRRRLGFLIREKQTLCHCDLFYSATKTRVK